MNCRQNQLLSSSGAKHLHTEPRFIYFSLLSLLFHFLITVWFLFVYEEKVICCHLELTVRPLLHDFTICFLDTKSAILPMCRICYCVHCGKNWIELDSHFMVPKPIRKSIWMYKCIICFFLFSGLKIESHLIFKSWSWKYQKIYMNVQVLKLRVGLNGLFHLYLLWVPESTKWPFLQSSHSENWRHK